MHLQQQGFKQSFTTSTHTSSTWMSISCTRSLVASSSSHSSNNSSINGIVETESASGHSGSTPSTSSTINNTPHTSNTSSSISRRSKSARPRLSDITAQALSNNRQSNQPQNDKAIHAAELPLAVGNNSVLSFDHLMPSQPVTLSNPQTSPVDSNSSSSSTTTSTSSTTTTIRSSDASSEKTKLSSSRISSRSSSSNNRSSSSSSTHHDGNNLLQQLNERQLQQLNDYLDYMLEINKVMNLTGVMTGNSQL